MKGPQEREQGDRERGSPTHVEHPEHGGDGGIHDTLASPAPEGAALVEDTIGYVAEPVDEPGRDTPRLGERLGHFQVLSCLGEGGMGVVYAAEDTTLRRMVALKVLADTGNDAELRARFLREARATSALSHPNIAAIYEVGDEHGFSFIAMELIRGGTLRARLLERTAAEPWLPVPEAMKVAREIARGLAKAHREGIIHRDLKPENVMLGEEEQVKLVDFGLAKAIDHGADPDLANASTSSGLDSIEGRIVGTPLYMSPEQAKGQPVGPRSDVFSFGVMLYEMLTGKRPFAGSSTVELFIAIDRDHPEPPSRLNPAVTQELEEVVIRCLHKDPEARYADADAILDDLEPLILEATSPGRLMMGTLPGARIDPHPTTHVRLIALVAAAALGLAGATGYAVYHSKTKPTPPLTTALTDLPAPASSSIEAIAAYQAGLRDRRLGNILTSEFDGALAIDPALGAAHLQLASLALYDVTEAKRDHFRKAEQLKASLSLRDQAFLDALEPIVHRQPSDWAEASRRIKAALERFPGDAQLWFELGYITAITDGFEAGDRYLTRALEVDPGYAEALSVRAHAFAYLGRFADAHAAFDACLRASPGSYLCNHELILLLENEGACDQVEGMARRMIAAGGDASMFTTLAEALASEGRPVATVREALRQGWGGIPAAGGGEGEIRQTIAADLLAGDFEVAERHTREVERTAEASRRAEEHAWPALKLTQIFTEIGRPQDAARVAEAYLSRRDAWELDPRADDFALSSDAAPPLLAAERSVGKLSREAFTARRDQWARAWEGRISPPLHAYIWLHGYAASVSNAEDAKDALAALTRYQPLPPYRPKTLADASVGLTFFLAGRIDEALPWLEQATRSCRALTFPIEHIRARYWLGLAREAKGDKTAACAAYRAVLDRWGEAKPRSVTADKSRDRTLALGCPKGR